jgi:predicted phage tail protein
MSVPLPCAGLPWSIDLANNTPTDGTLPDGGLAPGDYPVTVMAIDTVGNESAVASFTFTITSETTSDGSTLYLPLIAR